MRFLTIHKVSSYLMVACAFAPLALSGAVPPWLVLATIVAALPSYFFEPAQSTVAHTRTWAIAWTALTAVFAAWRVGEWLRGDPLVVGAVQVLSVMLVNKLWNRRSSRDYLQLYVVSFLMLVASTTINAGLVYALAFVGYVVFATWALTLFHLRREMEENHLLKHSGAQSQKVDPERILNSRRVVGGAFLAGTALVAAGVFIASSFLFFLFPRVELGGLFGQRRAGVLTTGFSDRIELGHYGLLHDNPQVVMRVEFPDGVPPGPLHFRGVAFDTYLDGRWSRTEPAHRAAAPGWGMYVTVQSLLGPGGSRGGAGDEKHEGLRQDIYLEPLDTPLLFAAERPSRFVVPAVKRAYDLRLDETSAYEVSATPVDAAGRALPITTGRRYTAWSDVDESWSRARPRPAREADETEEHLRRYLSIPATLPPRVLDLARRIVDEAHATTPSAKMEALAAWLRSHNRYTQELRRDAHFEPLEDFLFVEKSGHCEYFASALAVLGRVVGVPTRAINGFYGGEWNPYGGYLAVRQGDAHSWVEAFVDGDWVTYDATPALAGARPSPSLADRARQLGDTIQLAWFKYVIEFDRNKQLDLVVRLRRWLGGGEGGDARALHAIERHLPSLGAIVALLALALGLSIARRRKLAAADGPVAIARRRATHALDRALRALEKRGISRRRAETARELARRAVVEKDPGAAAFATLVDRYYAARFGGETVDGAELDRLAQEVARPVEEMRARAA